MMTEEDRKLLTEWLGECWHEGNEILPCSIGEMRTACKKCGSIGYNRTFTEPDDFFACFERLVEKNDLSLFYAWGGLIWAKTLTTYINHISGLMAWLLSKTDTGHYRFCVLLAEWLKEVQDE